MHDDDASGVGFFEGDEVAGAGEAWGEAGGDDAFGAGGGEGAHGGTVGAGVGIGDVDAGECVERADVELSVRRGAADRLAVEGDGVTVGMSQHAEIGAAKRLHAQGGGFGDVAGGMDFVVQRGHDAHAARLRGGCDADGVDQVEAGIGGERTGRALGADDDDGDGYFRRQVKEVSGFFQAGGAVADDNAGEVRVVGDEFVAEADEGFPLGIVDVGAGDGLEVDGDDIGGDGGFGKFGEDFAGLEHHAVGAVIQQFEVGGADRGDGAAGADEGDFGFHPVTFGRRACQSVSR